MNKLYNPLRGTKNRLKSFSRYTLKHTYSVKNFAMNYWDFGAMILAGFAFNDYNNQIFGDLRFPVVFMSGTLGLLGSGKSTNRFSRNFCAGFASLTYFWTRGIDTPLSTEIGNYVGGGLLTGISLLFDKERRRERCISSKNSLSSTKIESLEDLID